MIILKNKIWFSILFFITSLPLISVATNLIDIKDNLTVDNTVTPYTSAILGDLYDYGTGSINFTHTDVKLTGNFALRVAFSRTYEGYSLRRQKTALYDWSIDVPRIRTIVPVNWPNGYNGTPEIYGSSWAEGKECSGNQRPTFFPILTAAGTSTTNTTVFTDEIWQGVFIEVPEKINENLLINENGILTSKAYSKYITKSNWKISCIERPDGNGEGFEAISPEGTKYTFDILEVRYGISAGRAYIYASRVEDRFGNYVTYKYTGSRLDEISSSDGRLIEIKYKNGYVYSVIANGREWKYRAVDSNLEQVILPDETFWQFNFSNMTNNIGWALFSPFGCFTDSNSMIRMSLKAPSGVEGTYIFKRWVQGSYDNTTPIVVGATTTTWINGIPTTVNSYRQRFTTCYPTMVLTNKQLSGSGIYKPMSWSYDYIWDTNPDNRVDLSNIKPSSIDMKYHKAVKVTQPDNSVSIYYLKNVYDAIDNGKIVSIQHFDINNTNKPILQINYSYIRGDYLGNVNKIDGDIKKIENRVNLDKVEFIDSNGKKYITKYSDFSIYGVASKKYEYNTADIARVKYTKQYYNHDVDNWLLNLPTTTEISSDGINYTTVAETTYYPKDDVNYPFMPKYEKSYGVWQKYYKNYHADGNVKRIEFNQPLTVGSGNRYQEFNNYKAGQAQTITVPNRYNTGTMSMYRTVDDNGWVTQTKDFENNTINYGYDAIGRLAYVDPVDNKWLDTLITWSNNGGVNSNQPKRVVKRCTLNTAKNACATTEKLQTETFYDGLLRAKQVKTTDVANNINVYQNFKYNAYNKQIFASFASNSSGETLGTHYTYDGLQRLKTTRVDNGGTQSIDYLAGNKQKTTDFNGNETITTYVAYGEPSYQQPTLIESPEDVTTSLVVNVFGDVESITQSGSHKNGTISQTQTNLYNNQHQLCMVKRNDVGNTYYARNNLGEVTWQAQGVSGTSCSANGATAAQKVTFGYDNLGSQHTITYADGVTPNVTYTLDNNGDVKTLVSGNVTQSYNYNSARLLEDESLSIDGKSFALDYNYDKLGSLSALTYPSSSGVGTVSFAPNAFGQATKATRNGANYATNASYYANGLLNTFTYGNGITHKTTLNSRNMPNNIRDYKGASNKVNLSYTYDYQNNVKTITDSINPNFSLRNLSYDGLNRLTNTTGNAAIGSSSIIYDALGNITSYSSTSSIKPSNLTYTYNTSTNKLTGVSGNGAAGYNFNQTDSYDNRGNVTNNGMRSFTYNLANQMIQSGTNRYVYDGYNRRVKTQDSKGTSYSLYSQSGRLLYREVNGNPISYIFLGDKLIAKEGIMPASSDSRMHYKPFGDSIEPAKDEVGYTGHKFDTDLGLSYMQARYYDPVIGRFYSNDPVDAVSHLGTSNGINGFNRYSYANNNPYKYIDPNGEAPIGINTGGSLTFLGKGSLSSMILFDPDTFELAFVTNQEIGVGAGKGAGLFWNAVWTSDDVTIDDFAGTGIALSGSVDKINGSIALPDSHHGLDVTKDVVLHGKESPGSGVIYEAGLTLGAGTEGGVTRTNSQVYKTTIIADVVNEVKSWFD